MSIVGQFEKELDGLFKRRTQWLREAISGATFGRPKKFDKRIRDSVIEELQNLATEALAKDVARDAFDDLIYEKRRWHVKGWGLEEKKNKFKRWLEKEIMFKNYIYIFWGKKKCVYVGRTIGGKNRPTDHFEKYWFGRATRVDIYSTSLKSEVPKLECLAMHRFDPSENKNFPSLPLWSKSCPICDVHIDIERELRGIFNFK
ncbi:MAG: hypothetical protein OEV59_03125 [Deltaproteobacteria bacterium]|nr:hypothetical protein [Deltaproteobacteria bacterium]